MKLGETLQCQLRRRDDLEKAMRKFADNFQNILTHSGTRVSRLEISLGKCVLLLEAPKSSMNRIRQACEDQAMHSKAMIMNSGTNYKQVKMSYSHLRSEESEVAPTLQSLHAVISANSRRGP